MLTLCGRGTSQFRVYDVVTGQQVREFGRNDPVGTDFWLGPTGKYAMSITADSAARMWDVTAGEELERWPVGNLGWVMFSPEGDRVYLSGSATKGWRAYDFAAGKETIAPAKLGCHTMLAGNRERIAYEDDHLAVFDVTTGKEVRRIRREGKWDAKTDAATGWVCFSTDRTRFLTVHADKTAWVSQIDGGVFREIGRAGLHHPSGDSTFRCFSADGKTAAVVSRDGHVVVLRVVEPLPAKDKR